ncbi:MAG: 6-phosphogluconolactonase, partial [Armatimonadota bacterium]
SKAVKERGQAAVALAGGDTPRGLYILLSREPYVSAVSWKRILFFWGDERAVPPDNAQSNYRMAVDALLSRVPVQPENVFRIRAEAENLEAAASEYEELLRRTLPHSANGVPVFDIVLLGMGADGHTASLFPGSPALQERERFAVAVYVPQINQRRITLTYPVLNSARRLVFLVSGESKADALAKATAGPYNPENIPAQGIQTSSGDVLWLADADAGKLLLDRLPEKPA